MRILCAFDKFKDSISAFQAGEAINSALQNFNFSFQNIPLADGGEGFLQVLTQPLKLQKKTLSVIGPLGDVIESSYGFTKDLSVIEMSQVCGLNLIADYSKRNPMRTNTFGLGHLIKDSIDSGRKRILLGIGGSATNDAGLGALQALGLKIRCKKQDGIEYEIQDIVVGSDLESITSIDSSFLPKDIQIDVACDVTNPFIGPKGAVSIFSKQKGASPDDQVVLERGMKNIANLILKSTGVDVSDMEGAGAAGGVAGGFVSFLNARLVKGSVLIANTLDLEESIKNSDLIFTGEGCFDQQTEDGKVVSTVLSLCKKYNKKCVTVCGKNEVKGSTNVYDLLSMFEFQESMKNTFSCIEKLVKANQDEILKF